MKLIVGLGNPGTNYSLTRHNIGFMVIDALSDGSPFQKKHKSLIQKVTIGSHTVLLAKPQTFMNLSGEAVQEIMQFYKIDINDLLVVHDDKDQNFLSIKFQRARGSGGHNGIKDIHNKLGTEDYARLKLGVANEHLTDSDSKGPSTSDFVLANFNKKEQEQLPQFLQESVEATLCFIEHDLKTAENKFNKKV